MRGWVGKRMYLEREDRWIVSASGRQGEIDCEKRLVMHMQAERGWRERVEVWGDQQQRNRNGQGKKMQKVAKKEGSNGATD